MTHKSQTMTTWRKHQKLYILSGFLLLLLIANLVLFVPRYVHQSRLLTPAELTADSRELEQIANDGSTLSQQISQHQLTSSQQQQKYDSLLRQLDNLVVRLQTAPHVLSLEDQTKQTLQLAQIISFTLRDLRVQPPGQTLDLKAANTAQVLTQAANTAANLH